MNTGFPRPTDYSQRQSRNFPSGTLRVSDADRDAALAELSEHFQAGRLTAEELDQRTSQILAARTGDELQVQLSELPNNITAPAAPPSPQVRQPRMAPYLAPRVIMAGVILAVIASVLVLGSDHFGVHSWNAAVPVVVILLVVRRLGRRR